ncbi:MAG: SAM-dependent chlorinase/fluorinase [Phycisphaeraceae bacterium]
MPLITLTTDFGLGDIYVGVMKGVIHSIAPKATVIDITHDIAPQDLLGAALALEASTSYFPPGTIHVAVVDPGVGSFRRAVAIRTRRGDTCIGPDNGLFSLVLAHDPMDLAIELNRADFHRKPVSSTFHGRDVFAPVAAHLAQGANLKDVGSAIADPVRIDIPAPRIIDDRTVHAEVLHVDRFGNLITNLIGERLSVWVGDEKEHLTIDVAGRRILGLSRTFADAIEGQPVAYIGSGGRLEIAVRNGSAAGEMKVKRHAEVIIRR